MDDAALWAKYFDNWYNAQWGWDKPKEGYRENGRLALRCNWCAYLNNGWRHLEWHEKQPHWKTEKMLEERRDVLWERTLKRLHLLEGTECEQG